MFMKSIFIEVWWETVNPKQKFPLEAGICSPAILVLRRLNQEGRKSKGSLGYRARFYLRGQTWWHMPFNLSHLGGRDRISEFKASMIYIATSRPVRAIQ